MINKEFELKVMITKKEYNMLRKYIVNEYNQTNYYFDNLNFDIYKSKESLRIRKSNNTFEITNKTKKHNNNNKGVIIMNELNISINEIEFNKLISGENNINKYVKKEYSDLRNIGLLETKRAKLNLEDDMPLAELDYNEYNHLCDYELEWEISENLYKKALTILGKYGINIASRIIGKSKYVRFINSIRGE